MKKSKLLKNCIIAGTILGAAYVGTEHRQHINNKMQTEESLRIANATSEPCPFNDASIHNQPNNLCPFNDATLFEGIERNQ